MFIGYVSLFILTSILLSTFIHVTHYSLESQIEVLLNVNTRKKTLFSLTFEPRRAAS